MKTFKNPTIKISIFSRENIVTESGPVEPQPQLQDAFEKAKAMAGANGTRDYLTVTL